LSSNTIADVGVDSFGTSELDIRVQFKLLGAACPLIKKWAKR
jgi:hypothetical protein